MRRDANAPQQQHADHRELEKRRLQGVPKGTRSTDPQQGVGARAAWMEAVARRQT